MTAIDLRKRVHLFLVFLTLSAYCVADNTEDSKWISLNILDTQSIPWDERFRLILDNLPESSFTSVYAMFPDPWPKTRHARRRIFSPSMLDKLALCLKTGGSLRFASDHPVAKSWLLAEVLRNSAFSWTAQSAKDWRLRPSNWPQSRYMVKGEHEGRASSWFDFKRN